MERSEVGPVQEVELQEIPVISVKAENGPTGAAEAFQKIEAALGGNLRGRRFYGISNGVEYWANVAIKEGDNPKILGLEKGVVPAGRYAKRKIKDYDEASLGEVLPEAYDSLAREFAGRIDPERPSIEFYRSERELIIFLPIR